MFDAVLFFKQLFALLFSTDDQLTAGAVVLWFGMDTGKFWIAFVFLTLRSWGGLWFSLVLNLFVRAPANAALSRKTFRILTGSFLNARWPDSKAFSATM